MTELAEAIDALHRAGWCVGDTAFASEAGGRVWLVSGRNGENVIRAERATVVEAWRNVSLRRACNK
jgi:hypothetical protein